MSRTVLYGVFGVIGGFLIGILINQVQPIFPDLLSLLFVPTLIGGILSVSLAKELTRRKETQPESSRKTLLLPLVICGVIIIVYGFYYWFYILPGQKDLDLFIQQEKTSYQADRQRLKEEFVTDCLESATTEAQKAECYERNPF